DLHDLEITASAEQRREKLLSEPPLLRGHEIERYAYALSRPIRPVEARWVAELEREVLTLVEAEQHLRATGPAGDGGEQCARGFDHFRGRRHAARLLRAGRGREHCNAGQNADS